MAPHAARDRQSYGWIGPDAAKRAPTRLSSTPLPWAGHPDTVRPWSPPEAPHSTVARASPDERRSRGNDREVDCSGIASGWTHKPSKGKRQQRVKDRWARNAAEPDAPDGQRRMAAAHLEGSDTVTTASRPTPLDVWRLSAHVRMGEGLTGGRRQRSAAVRGDTEAGGGGTTEDPVHKPPEGGALRARHAGSAPQPSPHPPTPRCGTRQLTTPRVPMQRAALQLGPERTRATYAAWAWDSTRWRYADGCADMRTPEWWVADGTTRYTGPSVLRTDRPRCGEAGPHTALLHPPPLGGASRCRPAVVAP